MANASTVTAVPFIDLARQHAAQQAELEQALLDAFRAGSYCNGGSVRAFEAGIDAYLGGNTNPMALSSGTDALSLALQGLGMEPGDKVLTATFSFFASGSTISLGGGIPVFADVDPATYCVSRATLEAAWQPGIKGIIAVHLYGHPAPMDEIMAFAQEKGIWVIEDAAQSFGARYKQRPTGTIADAGTISFYPTKNLNACGDAGMILARDPAVAARIRLLRTHGENPKYTHIMLGRNARMDDLQAAILSVKLPKLDGWNVRRREIAAQYAAAFTDLPLTLPPVPDAVSEPIYHQYTIATPQRDALLAHLHSKNIGCGIYYPVPIHEQPLYAPLGIAPESLPVAHAKAKEVLSIPIFPQLTEDEIATVIGEVTAFFG